MSSSTQQTKVALGRMLSLLSLLIRCPQIESLGTRLSRPNTHSQFHSSVVCRLNRFLFDPSEVDEQGSELTVTLPKSDFRTKHATQILNLENGDTVRAGIVSCDHHDGLVTDAARVEWIQDGNGTKSSIHLRLDNLESPASLQKASSVSLILALPRPLQLGRMLPMIAQMGVDHLVLTEARKVPKDYFGSHYFRRPEELRQRLVEGLCQAGDVKLPELRVVRHLSRFLEDEMDSIFPEQDYARVIAHPQRDPNSPEIRMRDVQFPNKPPRMVVAVGPEGGWLEPDELERFHKHGFTQITLGSRTLRSDVAVVSLLSLAHDACDSKQ